MRSKLFQFLGLSVVGVLAAAPASAAISTSFSTQPVTDANAITDDPALLGRILNLMNVNAGAGDWTNSLIRIVLNTGNVYNATNAVGTENAPNGVKAFWTLPGFRNGPFDSFVNSKGDGTFSGPGDALILGGVDPAGNPTPPGTESGLKNTNPNATLVQYQWGDLVGTDSGTFSVGRFTLSADATGTFFGQTFEANGVAPVPFSGNIVGGVMTVPEPAALGFVGVACASGLVRRRRQAA